MFSSSSAKQLEISQDLSGGCELQFWSHHETWNLNKTTFGGVRLPGAGRLDLVPAPGIRAGKISADIGETEGSVLSDVAGARLPIMVFALELLKQPGLNFQ